MPGAGPRCGLVKAYPGLGVPGAGGVCVGLTCHVAQAQAYRARGGGLGPGVVSSWEPKWGGSEMRAHPGLGLPPQVAYFL